MTPDQIAAAFGCFGSPFSTPPAVRATPADQEKALHHLERHGTYAHTGYPFMQLANATGADYGDVLLYAEWWKNGRSQFKRNRTSLPVAVRNRIVNLINIDVHLRGGNHYPDAVP